MKDAGSLHILNLIEHLYYLLDIIAIERTEISDIKTLKHILMLGYQSFEGIVESE